MNYQQVLVLLEVWAYTMIPLNHAIPVKLCGEGLVAALASICGDRGFYSPGKDYSPPVSASRGGVVERCCKKHCDWSVLDSYCNHPITTPTTTIASTRTMTPSSSVQEAGSANEIITVDNLPTGYQGLLSGSRTSSTANFQEESTRRDLTDTSDPGTIKSSTTSPSERDEERNYGSEEGEGADGRNPSSASRDESLQEENDNDDGDEQHASNNCKGQSKERNKNRTSNEKRTKNSGRKKCMTAAERAEREEKRLAKLQRKDRKVRLRTRRQRKKLHGEKRDSGAATTPVVIQMVENPLKNGDFNNTHGKTSRANLTDTASSSTADTKKDGFLTTITAVLRDYVMSGLQQRNDDNR